MLLKGGLRSLAQHKLRLSDFNLWVCLAKRTLLLRGLSSTLPCLAECPADLADNLISYG